jgi:hypothetical protein
MSDSPPGPSVLMKKDTPITPAATELDEVKPPLVAAYLQR